MFEIAPEDEDRPQRLRRYGIGLALTSAAWGLMLFGVSISLPPTPAEATVDLEVPPMEAFVEPEVPELVQPDRPPGRSGFVGGGGGQPRTAPAPVEEAHDAPSELPPLQERVLDAVPVDLVPPGFELADPGLGPGTGTGTGTKLGPGSGGGGGGGASLQVRPTEISWKRRFPEPVYPQAALGLGLGEQTCMAEMSFSAKGRVERVAVDGCPAVFHASVSEALTKWTAYPLTVDGVRLPFHARIRVRFQER